jgi:rare lipoprotein A (peptidoglycan hydrolase)
MDEYVERAVAAYKNGPASDLALLLSARTLDQLYAYSELSGHTAREDGRALDQLLETKTVTEDMQDEIDEHKQRVLVRHEEIDTVAEAIEGHLTQRRTVLRQLTAEIADLEAQARAAAAQAANPDQALLDLLQPSGPAPEIPDGFASTGVGFEGIASWYGPGFEGNPTANGDIFDPDLFTAASKELPLGTWLYVTHNGRGVVVLVNDRGPYIDGRILDLSQAAAESIGITGLGWIEAEILIKT